MPPATKQRLEMIRKLVAHSVSTAMEEGQHHWLNEVFENGFIGYKNISNEQLRTEMKLHGLDSFDDADLEIDFDDEFDYEYADKLSSPPRHRLRTRPSRKNADD